MRFDETNGEVSVFRSPSNNSNGNTVDRQGRLITCEHLSRRVTRTNFDGSVSVLVDNIGGKRLNSPNDVVVRSDGTIWFSDPSYLAFSPDERLLYIADTGGTHQSGGPRHIRKFACSESGDLADGGIFAECSSGFFDGFRCDREGRIWTSAADGVHAYAPDGTLIGKILIPEIVANVTFGGPKRNRLYICGTTSLYSVLLMTNGSKLG